MNSMFNQLLNVKGTVVEGVRIADSPLRPEPVLEIRVSILGASSTMSSLMDVSCSILYGIGTSGLTKVEKRSVIAPSTTLTAPISMILFLSGLKPVVSRSNTTYRAYPLHRTVAMSEP